MGLSNLLQGCCYKFYFLLNLGSYLYLHELNVKLHSMQDHDALTLSSIWSLDADILNLLVSGRWNSSSLCFLFQSNMEDMQLGFNRILRLNPLF